MQSIGERLEEARKRKGISIREAAEATKIRGDYLHKFESNQFDIKLPEIYVRGFLRTYANYLKIPSEKIVADYNGLGLAESGKSGRAINREVYGRMDLSVASKAEKEATETGQPVATETSPPVEQGTRNPATFIPRPASGGAGGGNGITIDRDLLIKGGIAAVGLVVLVALVAWLFSDRTSNSPKVASTPTPAVPAPIWVKPSAGEKSLGLVALDRPVNATVTYFDGTVFFQGTIPAGEVRDVPRRGRAIKVLVDNPASFRMRMDGVDYSTLKDERGELMNAAMVDRK
jgi:cytoskeleton protein RodZ